MNAKDYAIAAHINPGDECRYGTRPYSVHLEDVVKNAERYSYYLQTEDKIDVLNACWLHDTIEDTENNARRLQHKFNTKTAEIVVAVSNVRALDKKEEILLTLVQIRKAGPLAIFVKLCDRMANGANSKSSIDDKSERTFKRYKNEYTIFKYALQIDNEYAEMWKELDEIFEIEPNK